MWSSVLSKLANSTDLNRAEIQFAMSSILAGEATLEDIREFLLGMKRKGETATEVAMLLEVMYAHATEIEIPERSVDIVGTGGDGFNTINISTPAAIITTAAGARVIKHGNRAASSTSGAADLLEELGVAINLTSEQVAKTVAKIGIGFAFAPIFHAAMRHAASARKAIGEPTIFNVLGPLANPAKPKAVAIGVARAEMMPVVAEVLAERGCEGFIFRGDEGLDEISIAGTTTLLQISAGKIRRHTLDPRELGFELSPISSIRGGTAAENAEVVREVFAGKEGPARDALVINAAAAIAAFKGDFDLGIEQQFANAIVLARGAIDSGRAGSLLQRWAEFTKELVNSSL